MRSVWLKLAGVTFAAGILILAAILLFGERLGDPFSSEESTGERSARPDTTASETSTPRKSPETPRAGTNAAPRVVNRVGKVFSLPEVT